MIDIIYKDINRYLSSIRAINTANEFIFDDYYLVIRNTTYYDGTNPAL